MREHLATCDQPHEACRSWRRPRARWPDRSSRWTPPAELRARVLSAVAATPQVPDDVHGGRPERVRPPHVTASRRQRRRCRPGRSAGAEPVSIDAARATTWSIAHGLVRPGRGGGHRHRGPGCLERRRSSDRSPTPRARSPACSRRSRWHAAAGDRCRRPGDQPPDPDQRHPGAADRGDPARRHAPTPRSPASRARSRQMQVQVASYQQQIADRGRSRGAHRAGRSARRPPRGPTSPRLPALTGRRRPRRAWPSSRPPGPATSWSRGFPRSAADQTYQAWYLAGGTPTSAGLVTAGPHGLAVVGGLDPVAGHGHHRADRRACGWRGPADRHAGRRRHSCRPPSRSGVLPPSSSAAADVLWPGCASEAALTHRRGVAR